MSEFSNIDELVPEIQKLADCLDLTRQGLGKGTGRDMLAHVAVKINDRAQRESGPDGEWAKNKGRYALRKAKKGYPVGKGLKGEGKGRMLDLDNIKGKQEITPTTATMTYGHSEADRKKAQWFTAGSEGTEDAEPSGAVGQEARPFYAMTEQDADEVLVIAEQAVQTFLEDGV